MTTNLNRYQQLSPEQRALLVQKMQAVRPQAGSLAWSPVVPLQVNDPLPSKERAPINHPVPPIWFIHPAGGALFWYLALLSHLGKGYSAYGLQGHGLYGDQTPLTNIPAMAQTYVPLIRAQQPVGPYTLAGYSMGGVIAFEVAQQLRAQGETVAHLFLLDAYLYTERLPYPGKEIVDADERLLVRMLAALPQGQSRALHKELSALSSHQARVAYLFQCGQSIGRIPANYTIGELRRMYEAMDAHVDALSAYRANPYGGQVTFLRCTDRSESDVAAYISWSAIARGGVRRFDLPGKHSTLLEEPNVQAVAQIMATCLATEEVAQ